MRPSPTEPLYTAEEMRAAEAGHDVAAMMQRAGAAVADEVMRRFPDARRIAIYAGGGANGGDGKIAGELLVAAGREIVEERPGRDRRCVARHRDEGRAARRHGAGDRADQRRRRSGRRGRHPVGRRRLDRRGRGRGGSRGRHRDDARPQGRPRRRAGTLPRGRGRRGGHRDRGGGDGERARDAGDPRRGAAPLAARQQVHVGPRPRRRRLARE